MATHYLPSSGGYSTDNQYVKYRIKIVEGTYDSSSNTRPVTISAQFWRTNSGYTTHMNGTCYCKINGTEYTQAVSYSNSAHAITYNSYTELFSKTITVSYDTNGNASLTAQAKINLSSSSTVGVSSSYQGDIITLTSVGSTTYTQTIYVRYQNTDGSWGSYNSVLSSNYAPNTICSWNYAEDEQYKAANISYTVTSTATNYVSVYRQQYAISYNANGGLYTPKTQTFLYGSDFYLTNIRPTRSGYTFLGWETSSSGTVIAYDSGVYYDTTNASNTTLYAVWQKNPIQNIYLCDNGTSHAFEYIESETFGFGSNGEIYAITFEEGNIDGGNFAIGTGFTACKLNEGNI